MLVVVMMIVTDGGFWELAGAGRDFLGARPGNVYQAMFRLV